MCDMSPCRISSQQYCRDILQSESDALNATKETIADLFRRVQITLLVAKYCTVWKFSVCDDLWREKL